MYGNNDRKYIVLFYNSGTLTIRCLLSYEFGIEWETWLVRIHIAESNLFEIVSHNL